MISVPWIVCMQSPINQSNDSVHLVIRQIKLEQFISLKRLRLINYNRRRLMNRYPSSREASNLHCRVDGSKNALSRKVS